MIYKIIVDKQSRTNPSTDKKIYEIDIEELRCKGDIYDSLTIEKDKTYVTRRLSLSELHVLKVLDEPKIEELEDFNIELFEGDNYIYLQDMIGNKFYAEYLVKNEFTEMYTTVAEMNSAINQTAQSIDLAVNQKLTNYSTTEQMNSAINLKANEIKSSVSDTYSTKEETAQAKNEAISSADTNTDNKLENYSTTIQMNSAIAQKADEITIEVNKKVNETELGTKIEQNYEHIKIAWNQISEFIQMMILNNNASLAILDSNKKVLMTLDKTGQHFYESDGTTLLGDIGVNKDTEDNEYLSFASVMNYGETLDTGMAWGIKTKSDNKFHPIMYMKNYDIPSGGEPYGQLELSNCDLVITGSLDEGSGGAIKCGNLFMGGNTQNGIAFMDYNGSYLLSIYKGDGTPIAPYDTIQIFDKMLFSKNVGGGNSFRIGTDDTNYCLFSDDGSAHCKNLAVGEIYINSDKNYIILDNIAIYGDTGKIVGDCNFSSLPTYQGNSLVWGSSGHKYHLEWTDSRLDFYVDVTNVGTLSDKRLKTEIQDIDDDFIKVIEEVEMKQFKVANRNGLISFGILAQDLIEIFKKYNKNPFDYEIIYETQYRTDDDTIYYAINYEQFLILKTKAQEQKLNKQEEIINNLIKRIEKLEANK